MLAPIIGRAAVGLASSRLARAAGGIIRTGTGGGGRIFGGRRRRSKSSLSGQEMGKLMFLSQVLGRRNPALTLVVMKALGGKL